MVFVLQLKVLKFEIVENKKGYLVKCVLEINDRIKVNFQILIPHIKSMLN